MPGLQEARGTGGARCDAQRHASRIRLINRRLWIPADAAYADPDAGRLAHRIGKHRDYPSVIIRKNSLCNRSEQGAATQAVLMSIYRTLKLRGHDPTKTIAQALRTFLQTGTLPPLPVEAVAEG